MRIRLAHSPDPDDAFMFFGLASGAVASGPFRFEHVLADIQTLNERALLGEYEVSAISIRAYPQVCERYALMSCGGSVGDNYGPLVVAARPMQPQELAGRTIAVPGRLTTAFLALQLALGPERFTAQVMPFDQIGAAVARGSVEAGVLIHEGQLTYGRQGLHRVLDLGQWWFERTGLPLPLGGNVVRRDLGPQVAAALTEIIRSSIRYGLDHRTAAVSYALRFGRGLDEPLAERFVSMYVNDWTLDYGERGREAIRRLLGEGAAVGLVPHPGTIEFV